MITFLAVVGGITMAVFIGGMVWGALYPFLCERVVRARDLGGALSTVRYVNRHTPGQAAALALLVAVGAVVLFVVSINVIDAWVLPWVRS